MKFYILIMFLSTAYTARVFHVRSSAGLYKLSYQTAHKECRQHGGHLATRAELEELRQTGYSLCACGWTLDKVAMYPMTRAVQGCGNKPGIIDCWRRDGLYDAWCYIGDSIGNCSTALGMEMGDGIKHYQLKSSSEFRSWWPVFRSSRWTAQIARLHNKDLVNAWVPERNHRGEYLEVDLDEPIAITGLVTQGASRIGRKMWVSQYKVKYSKDGFNFRTVMEDGKEKLFEGNVDNDGLKRNMFETPILARHIRIYPVVYHNDIALRIEVLGCAMEVYKAAEATSRDVEIQENATAKWSVFGH